MDNSFVPLIAAVVGLAFAMLICWLVWGKPLGQTRIALDDSRDALARKEADLRGALTEVVAYKRDADHAQPFVEKAAGLERELGIARATLAERDRAFAEAIAERDKVHMAQLAQLKQEFERLAGEALTRAQQQFLQQSEETLKRHRAEADKGLEAGKAAIGDLIRPMKDTLGRYETELKAIEQKREQAYGSLAEQLAAVAHGQSAVQAEAGKIVAALRSSAKASGAWGEAQLRNVLEMAGLREGIDYDLQTGTTDEEGRNRRPDAVLKLPGGRELVVDSKCSLADYLAASEATSDTDRAQSLKRHALSVRTHARGLSEKAYWKAYAGSADFVVMFLPGENFLAAALEQDLELLGWALDQKILLAGPTNLLAIARVVAMVWRQEKMAEEARAVGELGAQLYAALATMGEHINRVGKNIGDAAGAYNDFIGSLESNVLPKARKFPELGVEKGKKPIPDLNPVEKTLRLVQAPDIKRIDGTS